MHVADHTTRVIFPGVLAGVIVVVVGVVEAIAP